jgi:DNA mismatch repair protein MutL
MPTIRQLSTSVVNKIAAGEVIERPASVVKELIENALDAGATRVDVALAQGGAELVRVVDNGGGIAADELHLAVASHATSKLVEADDLFRVRTLGFRGEALASIAEVSRLVIRSRTSESTGGAELEVAAGRASPLAPCGCAVGTAVEVRDLFFNTPVRRKFLRSTQTEMGHASEAFTRLALAHPRVHFTLAHNGRLVYDLAPAEVWLGRIGRFFGQDLADELIWVESQDESAHLRGYVAPPSQSRANARMQFLFLNGRHIRDRALGHALSEAYRGLLLTGRHPISFLHFDMPPELVDVNVHPTKLEVRFRDGGRLYSQLLGTLRTKFLSVDLTHRLSPSRSGDDPSGAHDPARATQLRREIVDWAKGQLAAWSTPDSSSHGAAGDANRFDPAAPQPVRRPLELTRLDRHWTPVGGGEETAPGLDEPEAAFASLAGNTGAGDAVSAGGSQVGGAVPSSAPWPAATVRPLPALQIHNRYLVTESAEGVLVIDQHALHERILYELLREKVLACALEVQTLLVPEPVDLSAAEAALVLEHRELLARLGVRVEPFGGDTLLVSSYPAMLSAASPAEVLRDLVDQLARGGRSPEPRDLLDELLHMISCKAAIKAGDRLSDGEIASLLEQRHLAQDTHHCPHGRPTALVFTREALDRQFMRT